MKKRIISAIIALIISLPLVYVGGIPFYILAILIALLGFKEILDLIIKDDYWVRLVSFICFLFLIGTSITKTSLDNLLDFKVWLVLAIIFTAIFVLDVTYSVIIAYNLRNRIIIVEELKNEKIAKIPVIFEKRLKESIAGFKAFPNRLLKAFPNLDNNVFEMMKKWKEEAKDKKKEEKEHKKDN